MYEVTATASGYEPGSAETTVESGCPAETSIEMTPASP
jgi:hypothetical protein